MNFQLILESNQNALQFSCHTRRVYSVSVRRTDSFAIELESLEI